MEILNISDKNSKIVKIDTTDFSFPLYKSDLVKYQIEIGEIPEDVFEEIMNEILPKRALARSLKILTGRDITEGMLRDKLSADLYPEAIIDTVILKLKSERFINDERFIRGLIESKSHKKSKRDIMIALASKRIDMKLAERIYSEMSENGDLGEEETLIRKLLEKRHYDFENASFEERQKAIRYLLGKGFSMDSILCVIRFE